MQDSRLPEVFSDNIVEKPSTGCWIWNGSHHRYGMFWDGRRQWVAHQYAYIKCVGPVPEGLDLDHLCRECKRAAQRAYKARNRRQ